MTLPQRSYPELVARFPFGGARYLYYQATEERGDRLEDFLWGSPHVVCETIDTTNICIQLDAL